MVNKVYVNELDQLTPEEIQRLTSNGTAEKDTAAVCRRREVFLENNFSLVLLFCRKFTARINTALVPVKLALFFWFAGGYIYMTFLPVFFKQRGITLKDLYSVAGIAAAAVSVGSISSGVIADKIGTAKPVLLVSILVHILSLISMVVSPNIYQCSTDELMLQCSRNLDNVVAISDCNLLDTEISLRICNDSLQKQASALLEYENCSSWLKSASWKLQKNLLLRNLTPIIEDNSNYSGLCYFQVVPGTSNASVDCSTWIYQQCNNICTMASKCFQNNSLFTLYMVLYFLSYLTHTVTFRLLDASVIQLMKKHDAQFGRHRIFSITGGICGPLLAGFIVSFLSASGTSIDYSYAILTCISITILSCLSVLVMDVCAHEPSKQMWKKSLSLLKNADFTICLVVILICGADFNFSVNSRSWYLEKLGASPQLIGAVAAVGHIYGLPFLYISKWWIEKIGERQIFTLALLCYFVNNLSYSFLMAPTLALFLEMTQIFTYHLLWVNAIQHSENMAPHGIKATAVILTGTAHYPLGRALASLIGTTVQSRYNERTTYRAFAYMCGLTAVAYTLYLTLCKLGRRREQKKHKEPVHSFSLRENNVSMEWMPKIEKENWTQ